MNNLLSTDEINALLNFDTFSNIDEISDEYEIFKYHLDNIKVLDKSQINILYNTHNKFIKNISKELSLLLDDKITIDLINIEISKYDNFVASVFNPTSYNTFLINSFNEKCILEINSNLIFNFIDKMMGGNSANLGNNKNFTQIELNLLNLILKIILENLKYILNLQSIVVCDTQNSTKNIKDIDDDKEFLVVSMQVCGNNFANMINLCYPCDIIKNVLNNNIDKNIAFNLNLNCEVNLQPQKISICDFLELECDDIVFFKNTDDVVVSLENKNIFNGNTFEDNGFKKVKINNVYDNIIKQDINLKILKHKGIYDK